MTSDTKELADFQRNAREVAGILSALANERRLMILCQLVEYGEATVGSLVEAADISQSALCQHLSELRYEGIVTFRKESQTVWYRIADPRIVNLFATLPICFAARPASLEIDGEWIDDRVYPMVWLRRRVADRRLLLAAVAA